MSSVRVPADLRPHGLSRWLPFVDWLKRYPRHGLRHDLPAGLLAAMVVLPAALGYAHLAGQEPVAGVYAVLLSGIVFMCFTTSRHVAVGPTGTIALLVAEGIGAPRVTGELAASLAALLALMVGAVLLLASLLRLGFLTRLVSRPVSVGYILGTAVAIITSEFAALLGIELENRRFITAAIELVKRVGELQLQPALFGLATLAGYFVLRQIREALAPIGVLAASTAAVASFDLRRWGIQVVGQFPVARLEFGLPDVAWSEVVALIPAALAIAALVFLDSSQLAREYARAHAYRIRPNQELLALGAMNAIVGLGGAFPVSGNSGDTRVTESLGARTPLAGLVVCGLAVVVLLVGPSFPNIPRAALSVVVIGGVVGSVPWSMPLRVFHANRPEFVLLVIAFLGVVLVGLVAGLAIAVFASILHLLWLASRPHTAQLGEEPQTPNVFVDLDRHPDARAPPGVLVYRVDAALIFANAEQVTGAVLALVADRSNPTQVVVLDLRGVNAVDLTAYDALERLARDLELRGIQLVAANAKAKVREALSRYARHGGTLNPEFGTGDIGSAIARAMRDRE